VLYEELCYRGNTVYQSQGAAASLIFVSVMNCSAAHTDYISNKLILFSSTAVWIAVKCRVSRKYFFVGFSAFVTLSAYIHVMVTTVYNPFTLTYDSKPGQVFFT
jgi:hypothetical protein